MASGSVMITATEARQNLLGELVVHDEVRSLELSILEAVRIGVYEVVVSDGTPMTQSTPTTVEIWTVDTANNSLISPNHGLQTGNAVLVNTTGELPSPLQLGVYYWVIYQSADSFKLAATRAQALQMSPINIIFTLGVSNVQLVESGTGYIYPPSSVMVGGNPAKPAVVAAQLGYYGGVAKIAVVDPGQNFTDQPSAVITPVGNSAAAGTVWFVVVSAVVSSPGSSYRLNDVLTPLTGVGASASLVVTGVNSTGGITAVGVSRPGLYSTLPTLVSSSVAVSPSGGIGATLNLTMGIGAIDVDVGGLNYPAPPIVHIFGGNGVGATAVATVVAGSVVKLPVISNGSGYTALPTVVISSGVGASANVVLAPSSVVSTIIVSNDGETFGIEPPVTITSNGSGATVAAVYMSITQAMLSNAGSNYAVGDTILVSGGVGYANASILVTSVSPAGQIVAYTLTTGGKYTVLPTLNYNIVSGGSGIAAAFNLVSTISEVILGASGSKYATAPVVLVNGSGGTPANIIALITNGSVTRIVVLDGGIGWLATPTISITSGTGASGYAVLDPTQVLSLILDNPGIGYSTIQLTIDGNASGIAELGSDGQIIDLILTEAGSDYVIAPDVVITGDGHGAAAHAVLVPSPLAAVYMSNTGINYTSTPNIIVESSNSVVLGCLNGPGIARIDVDKPGEDYITVPTVAIVPNVHQVGNVVAPITSVSIGYSIYGFAVSYAGSRYNSTPNIVIGPPDTLNGIQATAVANLGFGYSTFTVQKYNDSNDYYAAWQGTAITTPTLIRPYQDQMNTVISYFTNLGYTINRQINANTNNTLQWSIKW